MDFREYCKIKEKEILEQLKEFKQNKESFSNSSEVDINECGEILENASDYNKYKLKRQFLRFVHPFQEKWQKHRYKNEIKKTPSKKEELEETLRQIRWVNKKFNGFIFKSGIFPNDKLVEIILEYGQTQNKTGNFVLKMLVSLFRCTMNEKGEVLSILENNIADFFDLNYQVLKDKKSSDLLFLFNKLFILCLSGEIREKYSMSITEIQNEIKRQDFNKDEKERKKLSQRLKVLNELKIYISGDEIICAPLSINYFKDLLIESGLPLDVQDFYLNKMYLFMKQEERKNSTYILNQHLKMEQIYIIKKASRLVEKKVDIAISKLIRRVIKDIVSMCKYKELEMIATVEQEMKFLDSIDYKIKVLEEIIKNGINNKVRSTFNYLTDNDCVPLLLTDIETKDIIDYQEIYYMLNILAQNHNIGKELGQFQGVNCYAIEGNCGTLLYTKYKKKIVIIRLIEDNKNIEYSRYLNKNIIEAMHKKLSEPVNHVVESVNERLVLHTLSLRENAKENGFCFKKKAKK